MNVCVDLGILKIQTSADLVSIVNENLVSIVYWTQQCLPYLFDYQS